MTSWDEHWQSGDTPWDAGGPAPALSALLADQSVTLPTGRALVPGCGAGYDVAALASAERRVFGLDIAPASAPRFAEVMREAGKAEYTSHVVADFFEPLPGEAGEAPFDLVYDYTFLCALPLEMRGDWAARMAALVRPGGELITLLFPMVTPPDDYEGPPWPLWPEHTSALLDDTFELVESRDVSESHEGREGKERLMRWRRRA